MRVKTSSAMRAVYMARIVELAEHRLVTAAELAMEIGVTERTVYRYVGRIRDCGIELRGEAGYGYRIFKKGASNGDRHGDQVDGLDEQPLVGMHEG